MARTGSSFQLRFERLPLISIGTAANLVVDQTIRQRLLESLVFHSCIHVQLLAIRGEDVSASGFPARALRHHGELAILHSAVVVLSTWPSGAVFFSAEESPDGYWPSVRPD